MLYINTLKNGTMCVDSKQQYKRSEKVHQQLKIKQKQCFHCIISKILYVSISHYLSKSRLYQIWQLHNFAHIPKTGSICKSFSSPLKHKSTKENTHLSGISVDISDGNIRIWDIKNKQQAYNSSFDRHCINNSTLVS